MRREFFAVLLLLSLAGTSLWIIRRTDSLVEEIGEHVTLSEKAALAGDPAYAAEQLEAALRLWLAARGYTQIVLRHPELDETTDVFYETLQTLLAEENRALPAAYERLRRHLSCIDEMEHISAGSVF